MTFSSNPFSKSFEDMMAAKTPPKPKPPKTSILAVYLKKVMIARIRLQYEPGRISVSRDNALLEIPTELALYQAISHTLRVERERFLGDGVVVIVADASYGVKLNRFDKIELTSLSSTLTRALTPEAIRAETSQLVREFKDSLVFKITELK